MAFDKDDLMDVRAHHPLDPPCSHDGCENPVVVGLSVLLPLASSWWCVEHLDLLRKYLTRVEAALRAVMTSAMVEDEDRNHLGPVEERSRRSGNDPSRLSQVAEAYIEGGATEVMNRERVSRSQAFRLITRAREAGLIPDRKSA